MQGRKLDFIRLKGEVKGRLPIKALVDSGSTHTFVDPKVVEKAGFSKNEYNDNHCSEAKCSSYSEESRLINLRSPV